MSQIVKVEGTVKSSLAPLHKLYLDLRVWFSPSYFLIPNQERKPSFVILYKLNRDERRILFFYFHKKKSCSSAGLTRWKVSRVHVKSIVKWSPLKSVVLVIKAAQHNKTCWENTRSSQWMSTNKTTQAGFPSSNISRKWTSDRAHEWVEVILTYFY